MVCENTNSVLICTLIALLYERGERRERKKGGSYVTILISGPGPLNPTPMGQLGFNLQIVPPIRIAHECHDS